MENSCHLSGRHVALPVAELRAACKRQNTGGSSQSVLHSAKRMVDADYHLACGTCCLGIITGKPFYPKGVEAATTGGCIAGRKRHGTLHRPANQLNPHFLFNSLNTLIAEIEYNPKNAVHFTKHLSSVYRYVLQSQDKTLVTLGEELEFIRSYLFLHEVRLGNCLTCQNNVPAEYAEKMLPPLTLQLLVENVIKHNSITPGKPMVITIRIEDEYLSVSNPIHPKKSVASSGIGLENLAKRCELMSGKKIIIKNETEKFTVKVPLLYE